MCTPSIWPIKYCSLALYLHEARHFRPIFHYRASFHDIESAYAIDFLFPDASQVSVFIL